MRTLTITAFAVIIAATGMYSLVQADVFRRTCQTPIAYRVGEIDDGFQTNSSTVRELLSESVAVWERNADKDLFVYSTSSADLVVNFTFDERQKRTRTRMNIADNLSALADSHESLRESIEEKRQQYESIRQGYEQSRQNYEDQLAEFNARVDRWNKRGAIPDDVRSELSSERQRLDDLRLSLENVQTRLESLRTSINELAERSNAIAENYNQKASTFEERFGSSQEFSQATYSNDTITVYQFNQADDLRLALLGHALGIKHVNDPQAIMNRLMEDQPLSDLSLTQADERALTEVCGR
jgi:DNA repair exonuclease SbcCD ATPase subunit